MPDRMRDPETPAELFVRGLMSYADYHYNMGAEAVEELEALIAAHRAAGYAEGLRRAAEVAENYAARMTHPEGCRQVAAAIRALAEGGNDAHQP